MSRKQQGGVIFRLMALLALLLLFAAAYLARHPLMRTASRLWIVSDPVERADAILVIGDDNFRGDRASRAAELFREGWTPLVVASGRRLRPYAGIAEFIERDLASRGVPPAHVVHFAHDAKDTLEEARSLGRFVSERKWHKVVVVTSNYHARRMRYIVRKVFPANVSVAVIPARDSDFDPDSWWQSRKSQQLFLHEIIGYCFAVWELRAAQRSL